VPHVDEFGAGRGEEHGALGTPSVRAAAGLPLRRDHGAVAAQPGRVSAAAGEGPRAGNAIAAIHRHCPGIGAGAPGEDGASILEDMAGDLRAEIRRGHRTAAGLAEAPRHACVGHGDLLHHLDEGDRVDLAAVEHAGQEQPE